MSARTTRPTSAFSLRRFATALVLLTACGGGGGAPSEPGTLVVTPGADARLELDDGSFVAVPGGAVTSQVTLTAEAIASPTAPAGMVLVSKMISDNYFCRSATTTFAASSAVRTVRRRGWANAYA